MSNTKNLNITVRASKAFSFIIDTFASSATSLMNILFGMAIEFSSTVKQKLVSTVTISKIQILISQITSIVRPLQTISLKTIRATYQFREIGKLSVIASQYMPLVLISKARQKLVSLIYQGKLQLSITTLLVTLYVLGDYDPDILGDLDIQTLGDLDYLVL